MGNEARESIWEDIQKDNAVWKTTELDLNREDIKEAIEKHANRDKAERDKVKRKEEERIVNWEYTGDSEGEGN